MSENKQITEEKFNKHKWQNRALFVAAMDALVIAMSYFMALLIRFDFRFSYIGETYISGYRTMIIPYIIVAIVVFWFLHLYHSIWRYVSFMEVQRLMIAWVIIGFATVGMYFVTGIRMPISYWIMGAVLSFLFTTGIRFAYRWLRSVKNERHAEGKYERIMVIGGGRTGKEIIHEYKISKALNADVCCVIDDAPNKIGRFVEDVKIVGDRNTIKENVEQYNIDRIILAIPDAVPQQRAEILKICSDTKCKVQTCPSITQLVDGTVSVSRVRDVEIEDLLGRDPISVNLDEIRDFISGKTVLVTGGGGSIGSELCRQIAASNPELLIIFDIFENNAYAIQQELKRKYGDTLHFETLIGSVRNTHRVNTVMEQYKPDIVFHAAAHKHVPLMEDSPNESIKNNVMGTYKVARAAMENGVKRFVLISTDKAVNPTNIMGASKRLCEMVIQMMNRRAEKTGKETQYVAVRFGNVLGSSGSVIPLFKQQIAEGGPVTVTDKNIIRYFMTIPEAVSLVLQAGYYAAGGEIFVLDMGSPVKIDDMARNLIKLSGYEPDVDIPIVYTGLRPGEKLYEERLMDEEGLKRTPNNLINIAEPIDMDDEKFNEQLTRLDEVSRSDSPEIRKVVAEIVPTYQPKEL